VVTRTRGLFGGTFDPPHLGHVAAAVAARDALDLDEVVVMVASDPRHREAPTAPAQVRLELARAAFAGLDRVVVSDLELHRPGPTYTVDTVELLLGGDPDLELVVIVGADAAAGLGDWHRSGDLARLVTIAVVPRPGAPDTVVPGGFRVQRVPMEPVDLSSTAVREALASGADPAGLVPASVVPLLLTHRLYSP
jgi:nicotinate-nucleotide adenylyltransferase